MHKERAPVNRVNMLWFDDDLRPLSEGATLERARLQKWLRYLNTGDRAERIRIIEVRDLRSFRRELEARHDKPASHADHIDAFLIDVQWRESIDDEWTFGELHDSFRNERIKAFDAGAQLIGLMLNERYQHLRPKWMDAYRRHPFTILTTYHNPDEVVRPHVDASVLRRINIIMKDNDVPEDQEPEPPFCTWASGLKRFDE
jgi:hypothetical protein